MFAQLLQPDLLRCRQFVILHHYCTCSLQWSERDVHLIAAVLSFKYRYAVQTVDQTGRCYKSS
jgi:hypothetical protein